nr:unnamed protein product [Callosobruchus chinensis]
MCERNAWPLHRMQGGALDHLSFRRRIAIAILEGNQRKFAKRSRSSLLENADSRYNRIDNLIVTQEKQTWCRHCHKKILACALQEEYHSVDEAMVPYNGRHGCKQYIHGKPIRYGFKLWVGTTRLGYINWFVPYQGASTYVNEAYKPFGVGASVVLSYADHLKSKWEDLKFHFFFDNFFTSPSLLETLEEKGIYGTGTIRENRIVMIRKHEKEKRGKFDYAKVQGRNIIFVKWNDNNIVCFASTKGGIEPVNPVKRYSQKEKKFVYIDQPHLVKLYNKNMGGVDRSDQNIAQYRVQIRGKNGIFLCCPIV